MSFVEVIVNSPGLRGRSVFTYSAPSDLSVEVGDLVRVPFGSRRVLGVVCRTDSQPMAETKDIEGVVESRAVWPWQIDLARWVAEYYCSSLSDAIRLVLPPALRRRATSAIRLARHQFDEGGLSIDEQALVALLRDSPAPVKLARARKALGASVVKSALRGLLARGIVSPVDVMPSRPTTARAASMADWYPPTEAGSQASEPVELTEDQQRVWSSLAADLAQPGARTYLLHGVTGSGKTEMYMRALAEVLRRNRQGLVLVPEIALHPQTVGRFASRFAGRVAVVHSGLPPSTLDLMWKRARGGEVDVVIGSRSALFAPLPDPGLIVIDEEHEWAYKQEQSPRYHARDVALKMAEITGAKVILGSATPDVVSYYHAESGRYSLLRLPSRVAAVEAGQIKGEQDKTSSVEDGRRAHQRSNALPQVEVIDMRRELRLGNRSIFSSALAEGIGQILSAGEQVILYLNRRGSATLVLCRDCGHVLRCRRCDLALVYHGAPELWATSGTLVCHQCNRTWRPPKSCPACGGGRIRYFGVGTERVEAEVRQRFPTARVVRWDRDVAKGPKDHQRIMRTFINRQADVLVGTQMIAKGLDFPFVTLVGVIDADTAIHLPDMRAGERTFQLLTQVAGRAGRAGQSGRVIVQTYSPDHYCIQAASRHDFEGFYRKEIEFRRQHQYPPWRQLTRLVYTHASEERCHAEAERLASRLRSELSLMGTSSLDVVGPAPAYYRRIRGRSRWQVLIRGGPVQELLPRLALPLGWAVDVDPISLL